MMARIDKKLYDQIVEYKNSIDPDISITKIVNRLLKKGLEESKKK